MDLLETMPYNPEDTLAKICSLVKKILIIIFEMILCHCSESVVLPVFKPLTYTVHPIAPVHEANMASINELHVPADSDSADPWSASTWCHGVRIYFWQLWIVEIKILPSKHESFKMEIWSSDPTFFFQTVGSAISGSGNTASWIPTPWWNVSRLVSLMFPMLFSLKFHVCSICSFYCKKIMMFHLNDLDANQPSSV